MFRRLTGRTPALASAVTAALLAAAAIAGLGAATSHTASAPTASVVWNGHPAGPNSVSWG